MHALSQPLYEYDYNHQLLNIQIKLMYIFTYLILYKEASLALYKLIKRQNTAPTHCLLSKQTHSIPTVEM